MPFMTAALKKSITYQRRRPENTLCYQIVQKHLNTFISERESEGRALPDYIIKEFEAFLRCGIPAYGFLRLKCESCLEEMIVAFSCKKRGFCPGCCGRRMAEAALHLTENVLPYVPYRQFVITFPIPLRYWLHSNKKLYAKIHSMVIKSIHDYYEASSGIKDSKAGSISFTQRWGSALNLNPHIHVLFTDGVYIEHDKHPRFHQIKQVTDQHIADLITRISQRVLKYLKKRGYLDPEGQIVEHPLADPLFQDSESLQMMTAGSITNRIAFGPHAGQKVRKIGSGFGYEEEVPLLRGKRCYSINGFSCHANTKINTHSRDKLRKLIQYISRGPLSNERLSMTEKGEVKLQLKTKWSDGTSHLLFTPSEFLEKLCALIPAPKSHLVRWAGVFAPNSPLRKKIVLKSNVKKGFQFEGDGEPKKKNNYCWSKLLSKVFKIDVERCKSCGGKLKAICAVMDSFSVQRYLKHVGIDPIPPQRAPPKNRQNYFDFDQSLQTQEDLPVISYD